MLKSKLFCRGRVIVTCVTNDMFTEYNATKEDTDGIVDKIRVTDGVEVAILAYQKGENLFKYSLRSISYVDVSKIAVSFGGGGHVRAAGFDACGSYEHILEKIIAMIDEQL